MKKCKECGAPVEIRVILEIYRDISCTNEDCTEHGWEGDVFEEDQNV